MSASALQIKAGVDVKAVWTSLNKGFLPKSWLTLTLSVYFITHCLCKFLGVFLVFWEKKNIFSQRKC